MGTASPHETAMTQVGLNALAGRSSRSRDGFGLRVLDWKLSVTQVAPLIEAMSTG